jgi:hypothetical protein
MRKVLGVVALATVVAGFVPTVAPAIPATATVKCAVVSPNDVRATCTYRSTKSDRQVLTAMTLKSYTIEWVSHGHHFSYVCTTGSCRIEPGRAFYADEGTTVRITVTKGFVAVREINLGGTAV